MRTIIGIALILAGTPALSASAPKTCAAQSEAVRRALLTIGRAGAGTLGSMDDDQLQGAARVIKREGAVALPCLVDVYRRGLTDAGIWKEAGPDPQVQGRILGLISDVDPDRAIVLYRELLNQDPVEPLRKASLEARMALLGAEDVLPDLTAFLSANAVVGKGEEQALRGTLRLAVDAVVRHNYTPALSALRDLSARGSQDVELPVHIAQLSGDKESLRSFLESPRLHSTALLAFERLGETDFLAELAADPKYRYRASARLAIEGKLGR